MKSERGFALVITLIVTALLVALLVEFVNEVYVDTSHSHNFVASQQAGILAASGIDGGIALLRTSANMRGGLKYSSLNEPWARPMAYDAGVGTVNILIEEESGKLDLNSATSQTGVQDPNNFYQETAKRLLTKLQLPADLYDTVSDWVDTDDTPRPSGAESNYYNSLKQPYSAHNDWLNTLEELTLVKGYTPLVLNKLRPYVTVYGSAQGIAAQININTAPKELLAALDERLMSSDLVDRILETRKTKPILSFADIPGFGDLAQKLSVKVVFQGTIYRIRAEGKVGESLSVAEAVVTDIQNSKPTVLYWREY
jgi:general secretion pathway protein K